MRTRIQFRTFVFYFIPFVLVACLIILSQRIYFHFHQPVIQLIDPEKCWLLIPTGAGFSQVVDSLNAKLTGFNQKYFKSLAEATKYDRHVKPGRYLLTNGMSLTELTDMLNRGLQAPVKVTFNNIRTKEYLCGRISRQIEADSISLIRLMSDASYLKTLDITPATLYTLFIPDTYEFWWNTAAEGFMKRMHSESQRFWQGKRTQLAASVGLTVPEVVILASIIEKETAMNDEKPVIAGVYINRLKKKWPLQADPTLIYAWNDYSIKRVLNRHKEIKSPYNTYKYRGLPPGPICLPSVASIEAVLNYREHDYFYFCAKDDFSGYHVFTSTLKEHNQNARRYRDALRRQKQ
jgi:UPF0755 protein